VTLRREVFDGNMRLTGPPKVPAQQSRNFTPNFKLKAIQMGRQIVLGGKGPGGTLGRSAAAAQLDIHESYIRRWERQEEQIKKSAAAQEGSEAGGGVDNDPNKRRRRAKGNRLSPQEENDVAAWMYKEKEVTGMLPSQDEVLEKIRAQVDPDFMNDPNDPAIRFNISRWFKGFCIRQSIRYELEVSAGVVGARQEVAYENGGQQGGHPEVIQQQQQEPVLQQVHGALVDHEQVLVTEI
jgi:transposase-like protein